MEWGSLLGRLFVGVSAFAILLLLLREAQQWRRSRSLEGERGRLARARWWRRAGGSLLVLVVLALLVYPPASRLSPVEELTKMLVCLVLSLVLMLLAVYDFRAMRRQLLLELQQFQAESAQDLRAFLETAAQEAAAQAGGEKAGCDDHEEHS